jgi:hypothetical protein
MVEPCLAFGGLEAFLDRPAQASDGGEFLQRRGVGGKCHIERHVGWIGDRAADQQPMISVDGFQAHPAGA